MHSRYPQFFVFDFLFTRRNTPTLRVGDEWRGLFIQSMIADREKRRARF